MNLIDSVNGINIYLTDCTIAFAGLCMAQYTNVHLTYKYDLWVSSFTPFITIQAPRVICYPIGTEFSLGHIISGMWLKKNN